MNYGDQYWFTLHDGWRIVGYFEDTQSASCLYLNIPMLYKIFINFILKYTEKYTINKTLWILEILYFSYIFTIDKKGTDSEWDLIIDPYRLVALWPLKFPGLCRELCSFHILQSEVSICLMQHSFFNY